MITPAKTLRFIGAGILGGLIAVAVYELAVTLIAILYGFAAEHPVIFSLVVAGIFVTLMADREPPAPPTDDSDPREGAAREVH